MTALMHDVMGRVQTLPERKQYEILDVISKLLNIVSDENTHRDEVVAYVDNHLTDDEQAIMAAAREEHTERPESSITLNDFMAKHRINGAELDKRYATRIVYS